MSGKKPKWDQAQEALQASRVLLEEGLYRDCISRAYYAMFDAAQALLNQTDTKQVLTKAFSFFSTSTTSKKIECPLK